jgi:hypothetical protein
MNLDHEEILRLAHQRINDCLLVQSWWRANEIRDNYLLIEGDQWLEDTYTRQNADGMPIRTINKLAPVVNAIAGFEIQNRSEVDYVPRKATEDQEGFSDLLNSVVRYISDDSKSDFQASLAFRDMLICGVGITDTNIVYDNNPDGEVVIERIFPYFMLWDVTARAKNLEDANWVMRAKIVDKDTMHNYLRGRPEDEENFDIEFGAAQDARFLDFFNTVMIAKSLGIIYEYQWREKVPFYRVENPLVGMELNPDEIRSQQILMLVEALKNNMNIDLANNKVFSLDPKDYRKVKEAFVSLDLPFKSIRQRKFKYYRATIVGNRVVDAEENFSQTGFSFKFMTGYFSEARQCYYGVVRAAKEPQRMLNQAVSDYEGFLRTIPKGGIEIEADAVPNMAAFVQTYTKAREVTIYNPGGLAKTRPKITPPIPSGLLDMINFAAVSIMETSGVNQDFMGIIDSKMMTATLNRQLVRQSLTTLSAYFDAKKFYTIDQGKLFIDCIRVLVENSEGRLIRVMSNGAIRYVPLLKDGIAAEYDIIVEDIPETPNERQETFTKLLEMASLLANKQNPIDIMPMVVQYSPLKSEQIQQINQMMQPVPPPPPDPVSQALLVAETNLKNSTAEKNSIDAMKSKLEVLQKQHELGLSEVQFNAQIEKIKADANLANAKAARETALTFKDII